MKNSRVIRGILGAATMFVAADVARAAVLQWDADGNAANGANGSTVAAKTWNLTASNTIWYNGSAPANDVAWTTPNDAVFGGTAGTVPVSSGVLPSTLTVNTDGYVFTTSAVKLVSGSAANVAINGNAEFTAGLQADGTTTIANAAKLTLTAGTSSLATVNGGSVAVAGGTLSFGNGVLNSALTQSGGTIGASASGNRPTIGSGRAGSLTLTQNAAVVNVEKLASSSTSTGVSLDVGTGNSGNGVLNINAGSVSVVNGAMLRVGVTGNGTTSGTVNVAGGTLTVTGSHPLTGNSTAYIVDGGSGVNATLAVSGGTATIDAIRFGNTATSGQGKLNVSGGALYVGSGGIATGTLPAANATITLSGGTLGARADWSSGMAMTLSGPATIKAADAADVARNIALSGNLSGNGELTKSGAGKLTLASAGYTGATNVTAGTLEVNGTVATSGVAVAGGATLQGTGVITNGVAVAGRASPAGTGLGTLKVGSATFDAGGSLDIDLGASSVSDVLAVTGALDISNASLNLTGTADNSTYVIATYGGTLTGTFANAPAGYQIDYGTGQNSQISVVAVVPEPVLMGVLLPGALLVLGRRSRRTR